MLRHSATADTLARWIKSVLRSSSIDTSVFKAHSVRSASSSHAYASGVPVTHPILRPADWTNEKRSGNITYEVVLLACNKMCLSMITVVLIGFGTKKSHNYSTMRSIWKKNLILNERYLP